MSAAIAEATEELLTSTEVCDATGATYRQLDHWTTRGYIKPSCIRPRPDVPWAKPAPPTAIVTSVREDRQAGVPVVVTMRRLGISKSSYYRALRGTPQRRQPKATDPSSPGSGYTRGWSPDEVAVIARMVRLVGIGLLPDRAAQFSRAASGNSVEAAPGVWITFTPADEDNLPVPGGAR